MSDQLREVANQSQAVEIKADRIKKSEINPAENLGPVIPFTIHIRVQRLQLFAGEIGGHG